MVLVDTPDGGRAVITDFGIARPANEDRGKTERNELIGTPAYMAPEQVTGETLGPYTDIYALGIVMFEMLTGTLPFRGEEPAQTAVKRLTTPPPSPRSVAVQDVDERWETAIMRCLERDPEKRWQSAI